MKEDYIFVSARLGFRSWLSSDIEKLTQINKNPAVMEFFPALPTAKQTAEFIARMQKQFLEKGFCYFAVEKLEDEKFIGFIGVSEQNFESDFTPFIDIGWRLAEKEWGKGYATEGAKRCLKYAFQDLHIKKVGAICPVANVKSEAVMIKIGMVKKKTFDHPLLELDEGLKKCVYYEIEKGG